jgi:hypothetical protein
MRCWLVRDVRFEIEPAQIQKERPVIQPKLNCFLIALQLALAIAHHPICKTEMIIGECAVRMLLKNDAMECY